MSTPASAANGILLTASASSQDDDKEHERVDECGQAGCCAATDVHRGPRDSRGSRNAAEERARNVGDALAEELTVWVVAVGHAHGVGNGG